MADATTLTSTPPADLTARPAPEPGGGPLPRLAVVGTGYLGATHAAAMAELGMRVVGVDTDQSKVDALSAGKVPFFEPGLPEMLTRNVDAGLLSFTTDLPSAVDGADVAFVCVGTPQAPASNAADLRYVDAAVTAVAAAATSDLLIVGKSTVPVGTADRLRGVVARTVAASVAAGTLPEGATVELVWNPEFLREGKAVDDTLAPDRIVVGGASPAAEALLRAVYAKPLSTGIPFVACDLPTAELVKVSANAFLATKISFINAIAQVCEVAGGDVAVLADAIGHDVRIGRQFLNAGLGFGGGCLPKDIRALMHRAGELGANWAVSLLQDVDEINMWQRQRVLDMAVEACGGSVLNRRVGVLGAAFKPLTDDVRDSPALNVAAALHLRGAQVTVFDPEAGEAARRLYPTLTYATSTEDAVRGVDVVLLLTEWDEFRTADPAALAPLTKHPVLVDARACIDPAAWRAGGWTVRTLGRPRA